MSTAGKVLTVLILLVMVGWLVMMSAVSQLNKNYGQKVAQQQKELDQLVVDVADSNAKNVLTIEQTRVEQDSTERDVRLLRIRIVNAERQLSSNNEKLSRVKNQVADLQVDLGRAQTNLANRDAEKAKREEELAKKKDEIAKAQAKNAELRTELAQLQDEFKRLLADNTAELSKASEKSATAKPASSVRIPPSL